MAEWYRGCSRCRHDQWDAHRKNGLLDGLWARFLWSETKRDLLPLPGRFEKMRKQGWSETEGVVKASRLVYGATVRQNPRKACVDSCGWITGLSMLGFL